MKSKTASSDQRWVENIIKSGTISDKVAALALLIQESPPHNVESLDNLVDLAMKKEQRTAILAIDALKDLFIHNLLPDRHLKPFKLYNWLDSNLTMEVGLLIHFEDELIKRFQRFVEALEMGLKSTVEYFKKHCLEVVSDLLINKSEQEAR
jgi:ribosome biogenesis protein MAK21